MFTKCLPAVVPVLLFMLSSGCGEPQPTLTPHSGETKMHATRLTDFDTPQQIEAWNILNDNVMGGRSIGNATFDNSVMTFAGSINTNGGGFSSVRMNIPHDTLTGYNQVLMRVKPDGRAYRLIIEDDLDTRRRRTVHRHDIQFGPAGEWQTVSVNLADLEPSIRGDPVKAEPLRKDLAVRIGIMLNDVDDGPFELQVDWVDLVP